MINTDENLINDILSLCNLNGYAPGAFLFNPDITGKKIQMRFIESLLKDINPEYILETGTESALFCYFVKCVLPKVKVVTFGMNDGCNETWY